MLALNKTPSLSCTAICLNMVANIQTTMKTTSTRLFFSFLFIFSLCILASLINEFRFDTLLNFGRCAFANTNPSQSNNSSSVTNFISDQNSNSSTDDIRILIGILTLPDQYQRRQFLRLVYGTQSPPMGAQVDVKFAFCNLTKEEQKLIVALEIMLYDDIIILNCTENMNNGKTYTFFSSLPEMLSSADKPYDYVMKGDDDIYIRLENLVESLRPLPRQDLYYGFVIPCESMEPFKGHYMAGMAYLVSWDIVEWIRVSEIPKNNLHGPEDKVFGEWLRDGRRGKNRYNAKWSMYNFPDPPNKCSHELWPDTVAVHKLKNQDKWVKTLKYFNVTQNLKPSKLYPNI